MSLTPTTLLSSHILVAVDSWKKKEEEEDEAAIQVGSSGSNPPVDTTPTPEETETNQTPPGVGSRGEGVASSPSNPPVLEMDTTPPEETAKIRQ